MYMELKTVIVVSSLVWDHEGRIAFAHLAHLLKKMFNIIWMNRRRGADGWSVCMSCGRLGARILAATGLSR